MTRQAAGLLGSAIRALIWLRRGAGRLLRDPVQVLCARHADCEVASGCVHFRIGARAVYGAHGHRFRRRVGANAKKTIEPLKSACTVLRFGELAERPVDWPNLATQDPEKLRARRKPFGLRQHQREALADVMAGFEATDRGKLIVAPADERSWPASPDGGGSFRTGLRLSWLGTATAFGRPAGPGCRRRPGVS